MSTFLFNRRKVHNLEIKISERDYVSSQRNTTYKLHIVEQTGKKREQNLEMGAGGGGGGRGGGGGEAYEKMEAKQIQVRAANRNYHRCE